MDQATELLTARELGRRYSVSPETVRDWARRNIIPSIRPSRKVIRFDPAAVRQALSNRANRAGVARG